MKRIQLAGLCLIATCAVNGIAAGSASAGWSPSPWVCAYMPVTEQTREFNAAKENNEGYYATQKECYAHGPSWTTKEIEQNKLGEGPPPANEGVGPWIGVVAKPGVKVGKLECRHAAFPEPGKFGEPGPYEDSKCGFLGPVARCTKLGSHNENGEEGCPYALVEPPGAKCEKAQGKVEAAESKLVAAEKKLKEDEEHGASSKTLEKDRKTVKKDKEKLEKARKVREKACTVKKKK
jgi:hypothetical protein